MSTPAPFDIGRFYSDNRNRVFGALRAHFERASVSDEDLADILQDLFALLLQSEPKVVARLNVGLVFLTAKRRVLDFLRQRRCLKRGGKMLSSLEKSLEEGFDYPAVDLAPEAETLELADLVIAAAIPGLSEREIILMGHIRQAAPYSELSITDLAASLTAEERLRFLAVRCPSSEYDETTFILNQVRRSRSALWRKLRAVREAMAFSES